MGKFLLCATFGLYLLQLCVAETQFNISCRYAGVFHVEKNRRYSLTRSEAIELCRALNSTLPTMEQMLKAHSLGFETCRYGYIDSAVVVPRINPYHLCAANSIGVYTLLSNITDRYDTYCFNASETREKACEPIIRLDASVSDNGSQIVIDNADGSRYKEGMKIESTTVEHDVNRDFGSAHDNSTMNPTIIMTDTTQDESSLDYSGSGRKEYHPTSINDVTKSLQEEKDEHSSVIPLTTDGIPGKGGVPNIGQHPTSTNAVSQANITVDEDSRAGLLNRGFLLEGDNNDTREEHPTRTSVDLHHDTRHVTTPHKKPFPSPWWHSVNSKEQHPTTAGNDVNSHEDGADDEDSTEEPLTSAVLPGWDINEVKKEYHPSANMSSHDDGAHDEDSTQDPLIPVISLGGEHSDDKKQHPPSTTADPHHGAHKETSTQHEWTRFPDIWWWSTRDHKEQHPTAATSDNDSQDYGEDDEDSTQDPLHSGIHPEWDKNDDEEQHPTITNVDAYSEPKRIETSQDPLLHNAYLGGDKDEEKYPTNTSVDSVKPALSPAKEKDHSSSNVTVNNEIGRNTYIPTAVVVSSEGAKKDDPTQEPMLNGTYPGWSNKVEYSTNATRDDILPGVIPSRGNEHSTAAEVSNDNIKHEDSTHSAVSPADPGWGREEIYPTSTTRTEVLHRFILPNESEHEDESSHTAVVTNGGAKHEDSTQDPLLHSVHHGWGNAAKYPTNVTRDDVLTGITPSSKNDQKTESSHTVVTAKDGVIYEESTHNSLPPASQPGWGREDKYHTNTSRDNVLHGHSPPNENEDESNTAVVSSNGATHKDSTEDPFLHGVHPGWGNEDKYLTNTSRDDVLPGIIHPSETEDKNESSHTVTIVVSNDGTKHEDSTKDQLATGIPPARDNEDKYPTNNTKDNVMPGIFSDFESRRGREPATTASIFTSNKYGGRRGGSTAITPGSQPRLAKIPEWLIIVAALLALALILAVCIAVNSRTRCGQRRKLVINDGKGSVSDKKMSGLNGEASKSQEMVHLVHQEQPDCEKGSSDEFLTKDETQNQQDADMKTGV